MVTTPIPVLAFHTASMYQQMDIGVVLRASADVYREEFISVVLGWLVDMCRCTIDGDPDLFTRLLAHAFAGQRLSTPGGKGTPLPPDLERLSGLPISRLDWIMQLDSRLWRETKWSMRQLYTAMSCVDNDVRAQVGE